MRNARWMLAWMAGAALIMGLSAISAAQFDKVIEERQELMKTIGGASKAMRSAADAAAVAASADKLAELFARINADSFPKGSSEGSRAKPEIWEQWDKFAATAKNAAGLAKDIAAKARAGADTAALVKSFGRNACGSCHRPFRKPKESS